MNALVGEIRSVHRNRARRNHGNRRAMVRIVIFVAFAIVATLAIADIYRMSLEIKQNLTTHFYERE